MPKGGCACGNVRLNYTGEPSAKVCLFYISYPINQF